ncbi:probable G-protein coupled receptor Mth-like 1 isoform X2 [Scylla paramamosain]|uniref:probable G-protein coupled receptor Mth-like 1 isoform X2 n=1 Tax=Scylla paramamosain TaxID=85552 RepID=UPI0030835C39
MTEATPPQRRCTNVSMPQCGAVVIALVVLSHTCLCVGEGHATPEMLEEGNTTTLMRDAALASQGVASVNPDQLFTTVGPQDTIVTTQEGRTTSQEHISTPPESGGEQRGRTTVLQPLLESGRVPTRVDQLVVCSCPEMTPDGCRRFLSDAYINSKDRDFEDVKIAVAELHVAVHDVTCEKKDHRFMNYSEGKFYYRKRGDVVLVDAGDQTGLRVNDFCADLRDDDHGHPTWNIKICIPPPSVPRCCPHGQALKDGMCQEAATPKLLAPPMSVKFLEKAIHWPVIKNHHHPLNCTTDPLLSIPLVPKESFLLAVPSGVLHAWNPADRHVKEYFTHPPNLCVDGYVNSNGSEVYSANICYSYPEVHRKVCDEHTCVRKCCPDGEEMSQMLFRCVSSNFKDFKPEFTSQPHDYRVVYGLPTCPFRSVLDANTKLIIDSRGNFNLSGNLLSAREYCLDKFSDGREKVEDKILVCIKEPTKLWPKIRKILFPICQIISLFFLLLTMGCYCVVPELLNGGGWYQLFHIVSLMVAYASMFAQGIFSTTWKKSTCFIMGIVLQFGFLSTFFWLNVLCFEVWRKIWSLNKFRPASVVPIWLYMLYAFGTPVAIGILTVCMQLFAPDDMPGVVKPRLVQGKCFFEGASSLLLYFYGPIGFLFALNIVFIVHTYWTYRKFEKNCSVLKTIPGSTGEKRALTEKIHRKRDYVSDFKQQFSLLVLMSLCWVSELLSWLIPLPEMWATTDTLNTLQGFFIFVIFIANRSKRKHLKKKFPLIFKFANRIRNVIRQCCCCCTGEQKTCLAQFDSFKRTLLSSFIASKFSRSSLSMDIPDNHTMKPAALEYDDITTLSHSSSKISSVSLQETTDTQYES